MADVKREGRPGGSSEGVREQVRKEQGRERLRRLLLDGANSVPATPADAGWFERLRRRVRERRNE